MSLVEATVILAVVAALSAILAPAIGGYVSDAQHAAAKKDVETLGAALTRMLNDVGEAWVVIDGNGAGVTDPPLHTAANRVDMLVSGGRIPVVGVARSAAGTDWDDVVGGAIAELDAHLVSNTPGYRTAANMSALDRFDPDSGALYNSEQAWRGAYLTGPIGPDPWGNRYSVNVEFLARALGAGPSGNVNDVFVVSAGPDGVIDTRFDVDGPTTGSDVLFIVSGGTR